MDEKLALSHVKSPMEAEKRIKNPASTMVKKIIVKILSLPFFIIIYRVYLSGGI
jgi:hypothetical protein